MPFNTCSCGSKISDSTSLGEAAISQKHYNFMINKGNASFNDMLKLIQFIEKNVKSKTGIKLETEIEIIE